MNNKRHNILDDAWEMPAEILGSAAHTLRVGLVTNTVIEAMPVVIDDLSQLVLENPTVDHGSLKKDLPILLHFNTDDLMAAILLVYEKETGNIQCYPFNNLNEGGYWWLYEMAFDITLYDLIEIRPIHPLLDEIEFEPTQGMMDHVEALATIVKSFLHRLQEGEITVYQDQTDYTKINKKRVKNKREPIINDWRISYVGKAD